MLNRNERLSFGLYYGVFFAIVFVLLTMNNFKEEFVLSDLLPVLSAFVFFGGVAFMACDESFERLFERMNQTSKNMNTGYFMVIPLLAVFVINYKVYEGVLLIAIVLLMVLLLVMHFIIVFQKRMANKYFDDWFADRLHETD